ncbi:T-cell receptor gamma-2 chain C region, partial [Bos mutus]
CDLTQDATYIHLYKQQEGMAPRRLFYYDVYYSKIQFESGTKKEKYSVYKVTGRSYRFAILNLEDSDSGMYYCAPESLCNNYKKNFNVGTKLVVTDRNLATDISPKPTIFLPSIAEINHSKTGTYLCLLEKFFPDIIKVYWKEKDGNKALPSQQGNTMKTTDTYMKLSWLTVTENSMEKEHICVVQHERNIGGINQEILFPSINEVVSSIVPTTESPSDCLNHESKVTGTGSKKACLKDESEVTADNNSTKVCLKDESNTLQLQLMNTSAYYTYLLLLLKSVVYCIIITSCVFRRTGICCDGKNL